MKKYPGLVTIPGVKGNREGLPRAGAVGAGSPPNRSLGVEHSCRNSLAEREGRLNTLPFPLLLSGLLLVAPLSQRTQLRASEQREHKMQLQGPGFRGTGQNGAGQKADEGKQIVSTRGKFSGGFLRKGQLDAMKTRESGGERKRAPPDLESHCCQMGEAPVPVERGSIH